MAWTDPRGWQTDVRWQRLLATLLFVACYPIVTVGLAIAAALLGGLVLWPMLGYFAVAMLIAKGGPILYFGIETSRDASLHMASLTFCLTVLARSTGATMWVLGIGIPLEGALAWTVWVRRQHNRLGILAGALIGLATGLTS